jgi:hypothetical protein
LTSQHRDQRKDDKLPETFGIAELPVGLSRIHLPMPAVRSLRGTRKGCVTAWLTKGDEGRDGTGYEARYTQAARHGVRERPINGCKHFVIIATTESKTSTPVCVASHCWMAYYLMMPVMST